MKRRLWIAGWLAFAASMVAMLSLFVCGIWFEAGRLAAIGGVLAVTNLAGGIAMGMWSDFACPKPNLPRADRKRLREEAQRKRLEAEIARLDEELGLNR